MGACVPECVRAYIFDTDLVIQGNKIFKKINTKLDTGDMKLTPQEEKSIQECNKLLEEAEKHRIEIAKKFESYLFNTGACVLTQPTFERGLITYIINLLTQIIICSNENNKNFSLSDISLNTFIVITDHLPFFEINKKMLIILKKKYGFDFYKNEFLKTGLNTIIDFLSTIPSIKKVLENQLIVLKNLAMESITNIEMLEQLYNAMDGIRFLINFFNEITNGTVETQLALTNPRKINLFYRVAFDAAKKKLKDPKEIALNYSSGDNCGNIENWKENMTYKETHSLKY